MYASFEIQSIQTDKEPVKLRPAGDLPQDQIVARQIGHYQCGSALPDGKIGLEKRDDDDLAAQNQHA